MNGRQHDPLDHSIRSALHDIVSESPAPGELPIRSLELRRTAEPVRSRRPMLVAAAAIIAVAGVAGTVAIANRSSGPSNVGAADTIEQSDTSVRDSTPNGIPVTVDTIVPTTSMWTVDTKLSANDGEHSLNELLYPIDAIDGSVHGGYFVPGTGYSSALISPTNHVFTLAVVSPAGNSGAPERTIEGVTFQYFNEDGHHVYVADTACGGVAVSTWAETEAWSKETLTLLSSVASDLNRDLTSGIYWSQPVGWATAEGGGEARIFDVSFGVRYPNNTTAARGRLVQTFAPLGYLVSQSGIGIVTARFIRISGFANGTDGGGLVLTDSAGRSYVGWNTTFGSALMQVDSTSGLASEEIHGVGDAAFVSQLEHGRDQQWAQVVYGELPQGQVGTTVQITGQATTSNPESDTSTTFTGEATLPTVTTAVAAGSPYLRCTYGPTPTTVRTAENG